MDEVLAAAMARDRARYLAWPPGSRPSVPLRPSTAATRSCARWPPRSGWARVASP